MKRTKRLTATKDLTRYALKGNKPTSKRQFALDSIRALVKKFNYNADLVSRMLPSEVLVEPDKIKQGYEDRYFTTPDQMIISADRKIYAVTGEWTKESTEKLVKILEDSSFKVIKKG